jgi:hypothetical protein
MRRLAQDVGADGRLFPRDSVFPYVLQTMFNARQMNSMNSMLPDDARGVPDIESAVGF